MSEKLTRREARENAFKAVFASSFNIGEGAELEIPTDMEDCELDAFGLELVEQYRLHSAQIDEMISAHLKKGWSLQRLPRVSLTALRLAIAEMVYGKEDLVSVAINEAVELTKLFGGEDEYQFVNGVLGTIARELPYAQEAPVSEDGQE